MTTKYFLCFVAGVFLLFACNVTPAKEVSRETDTSKIQEDTTRKTDISFIDDYKPEKASPGSFKAKQLKYARVREAFKTYGREAAEILAEKGLDIRKGELYFRAFKSESELELWGRHRGDKEFRLIKTFIICMKSGTLGPKRKRGDLQVPEGFYHLRYFNPVSNFHLSMEISYPNRSDKILKSGSDAGGEIYMHGACVTIGCLPMTDDVIKLLYPLCTEVRSAGQERIPFTIFPFRPTDANLKKYKKEFPDGDNDAHLLWDELAQAYRLFDKTKSLPEITFTSKGRHIIK